MAKKAAWLDTAAGSMLAIADEEALYLLEFAGRHGLKQEVERLRQKTKSTIVLGYTQPIRSIERELNQYFEKKLRKFNTAIFFLGSPFQKQVWEELQKTPLGETRSYSDIAVAIGRPSACRAVAQATGANQLAIVIPCHRVIHANGKLGGYAGGITCKKWLIAHEKECQSKGIAVHCKIALS